MRAILWSVSLAVFAIGCAADRTPPIRGAFVFGHEVRTFQPCGGPEVYWVQADPTELQELRAHHEAMTSTPYAQISVVVAGRIVDGPREGFAAEYDGLFRIERVLDVAQEVPSACLPAGSDR